MSAARCSCYDRPLLARFALDHPHRPSAIGHVLHMAAVRPHEPQCFVDFEARPTQIAVRPRAATRRVAPDVAQVPSNAAPDTASAAELIGPVRAWVAGAETRRDRKS